MMTANHQNGGRAVGAGTSDLRNPPAIQQFHNYGPLTAMHRAGFGPYAPFALEGNCCLRRYAIGSDFPGVKAGFYIDYAEGWECRHVVFGSFTRGAVQVWCADGGCDRCELARSLGKAKANHFRQRLSRLEVCR